VTDPISGEPTPDEGAPRKGWCDTRRVIPLLVLLAVGLGAGDAAPQAVGKLRLVSITSADLKGGVVSELA